jgi:hypothetical protein
MPPDPPEPVPEPAPAPLVRPIPRRYVALGLVVVALILLGALVLIRHAKAPRGTSTIETFTPAPASLITSLGHIPDAVINAVGATSPSETVTAPVRAGNAPLWQSTSHGVPALPVVFFYGAEFTPYAAAERWPVTVALSRFGHFGQLGLTQSSSSVIFPNLSTFTFWRSTYSSNWLGLQTVERYGSQNPTGVRYSSLQHPDARQAASIATYDKSSTAFPLLDIADRYVLDGSSFTPAVLAGLSQSQIVADLAFPTSPVTQAIVTSANEITAAICTVTGQRPAAVCAARGVAAADQKMGITPQD